MLNLDAHQMLQWVVSMLPADAWHRPEVKSTYENRCDLAAWVDGDLHFYEFKAATDTPKRLPMQVTSYGQLADFVHVVCAPKHGNECYWMAEKHLPCASVTTVCREPHGIVSEMRRWPSRSRVMGEANWLSYMLFDYEMADLARERGVLKGKGKSKHVLAARILPTLRPGEAKEIAERLWRTRNWDWFAVKKERDRAADAERNRTSPAAAKAIAGLLKAPL